MTEGDFDERIFLCDNVEEVLGTPIKQRPLEKSGDTTVKKSSGQLKDECQHETVNTNFFLVFLFLRCGYKRVFH